MTQIVLATHNAHKIAELQAIVSGVRPDIEVVGYDGPEPIEDGTTFQANALIKARTAARHTGLVALADDSGVCVDVLGGSPGVFSAYWAGHRKDDAANLELLLDQISDLSRDEDRTAHYTSVIALVTPTGEEHTVEGIWPGRIAREPRGDGGFGYDPIFVPEGSEKSAAELTAAEKNAVSHRARALEALVPLLAAL
ncbi:non-canonical purine NTP pyrophosphatase [Microbacterium nanhaiense]|uniref:dITP/XTP pyrophosphatase n=1 Tax=Microbacterium nanhaiense TaxID=1301026 RepID=A0ABQ2N0I8_9MICO|nr:RdgB/HAM1 family non-canonical purine NTP pyrophosphatase [Microbacterium nanhaiense]GGO59420.1 non-canonical purine NTP pyrophosphatase [Microbacterium nanhaiense]